MGIRWAAKAACVGALLATLGAGSAAAATLSPNRFDDPAPPAGQSCTPPAPPNGCSLRGAIDAAGTGDTVKLAAGTYTLSLDSLDFTKSLTIAGAGPQATIVKQTGIGRVFEVSATGFPWALQGLTVTGGNVVATSGANGSAAGDNGGPGTGIGGGGILTESPLSLTDVVVTGNKATAGNGGNGAAGNASTGGGGGGSAGDAAGGGIEAGAPLTLVRTTVTNNIAQGGTAGHGARGGSVTAGGSGGLGGNGLGGGIATFASGALTASDSLISGNSAQSGAGGNGGLGGTSKGAGGDAGDGGSGIGGGISSTGSVNLTNVTIEGNFALGQPGGAGGNARGTTAASNGGDSGEGGNGYGGGLDLLNGAVGHLASVTVIGNGLAVGAGRVGGSGSDGGTSGALGSPGADLGGNVSAITASVSLRDSIIAGGHAGSGEENCGKALGGSITSLGHNIEDHHQCFSAPDTGDRLDTGPKLGPLQNNGGPTATMAPQPGSPAIHGGEVGCVDAAGQPLNDDQRGFPRPLVCDVGAYQGQAASVAKPGLSGSPIPASRLTCVAAPPTGDPPLTSGVAWLRDGVAIAGQTSSTYTVAGGDVLHTLACRVTASNPWGSDSANSATVTAFHPRLTGLHIAPHRVRAGRKVRISFILNDASRVTFSLRRLVPGTKVGKRCVARAGKHKHGKKCTRSRPVHHAPAAVDGAAGSGHVTWTPHGLKPGRYRLTATPTGGTGESVTFTVARRHRRK
jgi:hypothetical protein